MPAIIESEGGIETETTATLNAAMRYIEQHLFDVINFDEVAKIALCSEYQFRRMFSYLAGMSLTEYIRKRRLSLAVEMLQSGCEKVIDIALKCGYESPDAFGKAFQVLYGITPSAVRKQADALKAFPPLFFHLTLRGGIMMEYRVVEREAFYLMGKTGYIPLIYYGPNPHTANVWKQLKQEDLLVLMEHSEVDPKGIVCVYGHSLKGNVPAQEGDDVLMAVGVIKEKPMPDRFKGRFDVLSFEASTWLIFPAMDNIRQNNVIFSTKETWGRITEWLPTSDYEQTDAPNIIWTESYDFSKPDKRSEIWVPVRKRST